MTKKRDLRLSATLLFGVLFCIGFAASPQIGKGKDTMATVGSGMHGSPLAADSLRKKPTVPKDPERALEFFVKGSLYEGRGEFEAAAAEYEQALQFDENASIYAGLANAYLELNNPGKALAPAQSAVALEPENVKYREQLAGIYDELRMTDSAMVQLEHIVAREPSNPEAQLLLAGYIKDKDPERAVAILRHIIETHGDDWETWSRIAEIYTDAGRLELAIEALEALRRIDPQNQILLATLAGLYRETGEPMKALETYRALAAVNATYPGFLFPQMEIQLGLRQWDSARAIAHTLLAMDSLTAPQALQIADVYFETAMQDSLSAPDALAVFTSLERRFPNQWQMDWYSAVLHFRTENYIASSHYAQRVLTLAPEFDQARDVAARVYVARGLNDSALTILGPLIEAPNPSAEFLAFLGYLYHKTGQDSLAIDTYHRALKLNPNELEAMSQLASLYDEKKEFQRSDSLYNASIAMYETAESVSDPLYYLVLNNYAYSLAGRGTKLGKALDMAAKAVAFEPSNSSYLDTKGWICYQMARYEEAKKYIEQAIALRQREGAHAGSVLHDHLGDVYYRLGDAARAVDQWKKALERAPGNRRIEEKVMKETL